MTCRSFAITAGFRPVRCVNESGHRLKFRVARFRWRRQMFLSILADADSSLHA